MSDRPREVAPLRDTFFVVFEFIAYMFDILDDRTLDFFLVVAKAIFYDHTKN